MGVIREQFEAWARASTSHNLVSLRNGRYVDRETAAAWRAWQAALPHMQGQATPVDGNPPVLAGEAVALTLGQRAVARELLACCESWEPNVCVMGNVRAKDAADLLRFVLATPPQPSAEPQQEADSERVSQEHVGNLMQFIASAPRTEYELPEPPPAWPPEQPQQEAQGAEESPPCSTHPEAPHGFDRTSSHSLDRYVCECEGWTPPATQPTPVDVRVEALRNRFLSDTSSLPEEWQDWREDFRRDIQALLDGQQAGVDRG